ncbi:hypothetical protein K1T71_013638 [Dendrolimus kikuchii]|uniref:Uncharacterized protein n=1 Tax=Dendrolimus kikuchii TaxID=765133 RepID=A0ACC1CGZ8_9NEOP|nr:hypothetical protein K1T71_013638 [Dendrolimus kikuchii]
MYKLVILVTISCALALPNPEAEKLDKVKQTKKECASGLLSPACLKIGALTLLEKLNTKDEVALIPGVSLVKDGEEKGKYEAVAAEIARSMSSDPEERLDKFLVYNVGAFLDSHSVKLKLVDDSAVEEARKIVEEGRGNKNPLSVGGKKGGMGGLIAMAMMMKALANALPNPDVTTPRAPEAIETSRSIGKDCSGGIFSPTCLKIEAVAILEKLNMKEELQLLPGVSIVKEHVKYNESKSDEFAAELARALPSKPDERLDKYLLYKLGNYLESHTVKLRLLDDTAVEEARTIVGDARAKGGFGGGKKGGMGGLLAAGMLMKGTLMSMGLGALALLAGKALMTAMMSLLLSAVIGLKSLSGGQKSTTYEIVSKPVYSHSHSHSTAHEDVGGYGHSGYGRNLNVRRR